MQFLISFVATLVVLGQVSMGRRSFGPGVCGPIDPVYARTAAETGGSLSQWAPTKSPKWHPF